MTDIHGEILAAGDGAGAEIIRDLAIAGNQPLKVDTEQPTAFIVPTGARLELVDPERYDRLNDNPRRKHGTVNPADVTSFIHYVGQHNEGDATSVWVDSTTGRSVAVLNDHTARDEHAGWGDHRAVFSPETTPEWRRWISADGKLMDQEAFAQFLEDGLSEIAIPDGTVLLEVAKTLEGKHNVEWGAAVRLDNGAVRASYIETATAKAGQRGDLEVPTDFTLVLPVFRGEEPVQIDAKLRWRLREQKLQLAFRLDNPHRAVQAAIDAIVEKLRDKFDHVYVGQPR